MANNLFENLVLRQNGYSIDKRTGIIVESQDTDTIDHRIKQCLLVMDRQDAIRRYKWYNLGRIEHMTSDLLERMKYYRYSVMLFFDRDKEDKTKGTFYILPFTLNKDLTIYGQYNYLRPIPFNGVAEADEDKVNKKVFPSNITRKPLYSLEDAFEAIEKGENLLDEYCVILKDYTPGINANWALPRSQLQEVLIDMMAEALPIARTSAITHSGVTAVNVTTEDEADQVYLLAKALPELAKNGVGFMPVVGANAGDRQPITKDGGYNIEEYLKYLESLNNQRLNNLGLGNDGIYQKNQYKNNSEVNASSSTNRYFEDGLSLNQDFCDLANFWSLEVGGLDLWCEPTESAVEQDMNGDLNQSGSRMPNETNQPQESDGDIDV